MTGDSCRVLACLSLSQAIIFSIRDLMNNSTASSTLSTPPSSFSFSLRLFFLCALLSTHSAFAFFPSLPNRSNDSLEASTSSSSSTNNKMRAWHCHGRTQKELVDRLTQAGIVTSPQVRAVLQQVDRQYYIPNNPYQDAPQTLGHGQTISAPHMHAHALQEMVPHLLQQCQSQTSSVLKILDVGCGSGYLTACLGRWFQTRPKQTDHNTHESIIPCKGRVFGIDIVPSLVQLSKNNILKHDKDLIDTGTVTLQLSNGWDGLPEEAPFAAIHVGAAAPSFPHQLAQQLAIGGVMIVPIGPTGGVQTLVKVIRTGNQGTATTSFVQSDFQISELLAVRYVPLVEGP